MYHNSSSTSNILLNNSRRLVTSVSNNRNGFESDNKIIYFKSRIKDFEDKNNIIKRKEQRSLETESKKKEKIQLLYQILQKIQIYQLHVNHIIKIIQIIILEEILMEIIMNL